MEILIVFKGRNAMLAAEASLKMNNIYTRTVNAPTNIGQHGCGLSLIIQKESLCAAQAALQNVRDVVGYYQIINTQYGQLYDRI